MLASPVGARFCMAGSTELGVGVAVCEYDRPEAARAGRERSRAVFDRLIPDRELLVRGTTLLTLTRPDADRRRAPGPGAQRGPGLHRPLTMTNP